MFPLQEAYCEPIQEPTIASQPIVPRPKDYIIWSLCSFMYGNPFCFGLLAVYHSIKSRDMKVLGDLEAARTYGNTARIYNIVTLTLIIFFLVILVIQYGIFYYYINRLAERFQG
ncbi:hypothetical protein UPYG_G00258760 [Umbra pygmaea]|uniref:Interferon-induced transmembrane protein n=1 Tax=Umbra pygmaea TaxID=75934 RepID=A0ABD0WYX5_UMBPY